MDHALRIDEKTPGISEGHMGIGNSKITRGPYFADRHGNRASDDGPDEETPLPKRQKVDPTPKPPSDDGKDASDSIGTDSEEETPVPKRPKVSSPVLRRRARGEVADDSDDAEQDVPQSKRQKVASIAEGDLAPTPPRARSISPPARPSWADADVDASSASGDEGSAPTPGRATSHDEIPKTPADEDSVGSGSSDDELSVETTTTKKSAAKKPADDDSIGSQSSGDELSVETPVAVAKSSKKPAAKPVARKGIAKKPADEDSIGGQVSEDDASPKTPAAKKGIAKKPTENDSIGSGSSGDELSADTPVLPAKPIKKLAAMPAAKPATKKPAAKKPAANKRTIPQVDGSDSSSDDMPVPLGLALAPGASVDSSARQHSTDTPIPDPEWNMSTQASDSLLLHVVNGKVHYNDAYMPPYVGSNVSR